MRDAIRRHARAAWVVGGLVLVGAIATPLAFAAGGGPIKAEQRNPRHGTYYRQTEIIANNSTYATRQSNKGTGGGAVYGCRTTPGNEPCVRASNLRSGLAFRFETDGNTGGQIEVQHGGDGAKPFTTNATGVATGLNADRVDGLNAAQIIAQAAAKGAGGAACPAGTAAFAGSCFEKAPRGVLDFAAASATCGASGRRLATTSELLGLRAVQGITLSGAEMSSDVVSNDGAAAYVTVTQQGALGSQSPGTGSAFRCVAPAVAPTG